MGNEARALDEAHWAGDVLIALEYNWTSMKNYNMHSMKMEIYAELKFA